MKLNKFKTCIENKCNMTTLSSDSFQFDLAFIDSHIKNIRSVSDVSFAQASVGALTAIGFIFAHANLQNTSLYFCDLSDSGTGKTFNFTLQYKLLLQFISEMQEKEQLKNVESDEIKRFHNIHRSKITVPALNQCIHTVPSQLLIIDELGLLMSKGNEIIDEVTRLYGLDEIALAVTKGEAPLNKNIVPVKFSFMGATTLSYFGSKKAVMKELLGGFINRQLITYNTSLKKPQEIVSIFSDNLDYQMSNTKAKQLFHFAKSCNLKFQYSKESEELQISFKQEVQAIRIKFKNMGTEFGMFYARVEQNLQIIINILHILQCHEKKSWVETIDFTITKKAIDFFKLVVFVEIDRLISYLSDDELLEREEIQKVKIKSFVEEFYKNNYRMPKIRDISLKTRLSKSQILELTRDYLEMIPGSTILRYCNTVKGYHEKQP